MLRVFSWETRVFSTLNTQLSPGLHLLPAFTIPRLRDDWPWEVVSSYSSATAPGLHGISRADPLSLSSQRTRSRISGSHSPTQVQISRRLFFFCHVERQRDVASI